MRMTPEQIAESERATVRAFTTVKQGDIIQFTRCGGMKSRAKFMWWHGPWLCSASLDDIAARHIFKLNGEPIDFTDAGGIEITGAMQADYDAHIGKWRRLWEEERRRHEYWLAGQSCHAGNDDGSIPF